MKKSNKDYTYVSIQSIFFLYILLLTVLTFACETILNLIGTILITLGILMGLLSVSTQ